jgi:hypothetical protein
MAIVVDEDILNHPIASQRAMAYGILLQLKRTGRLLPFIQLGSLVLAKDLHRLTSMMTLGIMDTSSLQIIINKHEWKYACNFCSDSVKGGGVLQWIVTGDERQVHHYKPAKEQ